MRDVVFDLGQCHRVLFASEADGVAFRPGARRAADAMHVVGRVLRQIVIEHVAHIGDVQATGRHVGADEHRQFATVEFLHEAQAFFLRHVAGQGLRLETIGDEIGLELFRDAFGVDEHHRATRLVLP